MKGFSRRSWVASVLGGVASLLFGVKVTKAGPGGNVLRRTCGGKWESSPERFFDRVQMPYPAGSFGVSPAKSEMVMYKHTPHKGGALWMRIAEEEVRIGDKVLVVGWVKGKLEWVKYFVVKEGNRNTSGELAGVFGWME